MICPSCQTNQAVKHYTLGIIPCTDCRARQAALNAPKHLPEFTSSSIKQQRKEFSDDIEQPHRKGQLNKRWVELHGHKAAKQLGFSETEIKTAKYVYSGDDAANSYYKK